MCRGGIFCQSGRRGSVRSKMRRMELTGRLIRRRGFVDAVREDMQVLGVTEEDVEDKTR